MTMCLIGLVVSVVLEELGTALGAGVKPGGDDGPAVGDAPGASVGVATGDAVAPATADTRGCGAPTVAPPWHPARSVIAKKSSNLRNDIVPRIPRPV